MHPRLHSSMTRVARSRLLSIGCAILFVTASVASQVAHAVDTALIFDIGTDIDPALMPLVYVDGVLRGAASGQIAVSQDEDSVIEIGLPQMRHALYSFALGPKDFEASSVEVTASFYSHEGFNDPGLWSSVIAQPNKRVAAKIEQTDGSSTILHLPPESYNSFRRLIADNGISFFTQDWIEAIPAENDVSTTLGVEHLRFVSSTSAFWSGSYSAATRNSWGWGGGRGQARQKWRINSTPPEASIKTNEGDKGYTNRTIELPKLHESYVILRKKGYFDRPHTECNRATKNDTVELSCELVSSQ